MPRKKHKSTVADPEILKKGDTMFQTRHRLLQIHMINCIRVLYRKKRLAEKILRPIGEADAPPPLPLLEYCELVLHILYMTLYT